MNQKYSLLAALLLSGCSQTAYPPLPTVNQVEISRYTGNWFEIAKLPNRFQSECVADTKANYLLDDTQLIVLNSCITNKGETIRAKGIAKTIKNSGNAKLKVSFFRPFYGDYWILALDEDYQWALVGEPSRHYGWILSRTPYLDEPTLAEIIDIAVSLGYDRNAFTRTFHHLK